MPRLLIKYRKEVIPALQKEFGIKNVMAVPKVEKVVVNVGVGKIAKEDKVVEKIANDLAKLTGQKPVFRKAKKSIASFKVRQGVNIGLMTTLRGKRMYDFMDRLISISLPRSKDFRGIDVKNFDKNGNLNLGIKESSIFPEVTYETLKDIFSLEVTVATTAKDQQKGIALLRNLGFPIRKN
ncbi:MAG: 50S ribosomal protein L5 [Candidatus Yanofskybacteria bacterium RIFCSPHIGHO2_02_FULL_43_22]|uniref:Large ribosomal subunit protein uL5 n=1 Tax=Candidatus Yanofskybacteria bacterium RIFCSPHIGHO2_02_FULL_43_22 TaxID=1802681 RepID=A0A1F8FLI9_9BACT|nr:MAG: 50S ribosomal protein L5 [Candidatus Yanofskybacteria bacterium RIFCSPHIGHO2_02_FULL_43_22]